MDMSDEDLPVLEGFICPICKEDLLSDVSLLSHFQDSHSEEQDLIKSFKDLLEKAKKKLLKQDSSPDHNSSSHSRHSSSVASFEYINETQEIGAVSSYTKLFIRLRDDRVQRLSLPTNQLLIRLNKLLDNMPTDVIKKKAHEQKIVNWVDGSTVTRCPDCTGIFHLARRKHHCRTCGGIMCNDCSHFINIDIARKILDLEPEVSDPSQNSSDKSLRLCVHCIKLLETRERKRELTESNPLIRQLYNLLSQARSESQILHKQYMNMYRSFNAGESTHSLQDAHAVRIKLIKLAETIDFVSLKIQKLGQGEGDKGDGGDGASEKAPNGDKLSGVELRLRNGIRVGATSYLRSKLLTLPNLPSEQELAQRQERKRCQIAEEIKEKKRLSAIRQGAIAANSNSGSGSGATSTSQNSNESSNGGSNSSSRLGPGSSNQHQQAQQVSPESSSSYQSTGMVLGQGWVPQERKKKSNEMDDPLIEQMNIIRFYIKEARSAQRLDEVQSLEENLKELKKEFWKKQQLEENNTLGGNNDFIDDISLESAAAIND